MSNAYLQQQLAKALNVELCKRYLVRYFKGKGFTENFNKKIYPPTIQDLPMLVPQITDKIEIEAVVNDINPLTGQHKLGWNLYVFGVHRMYLGESTHVDMSDVMSTVNISGGEPLQKVNYSTPKRVINFITKMIAKDKNGYINSKIVNPKMPLAMGRSDSSGFYKKRFV